MTIIEFQEQYRHLTHAELSAALRESVEFRQTIAALYQRCYKQPVQGGCINCWADAFILLMRIKPETFDAMENRLFDLKAGALLTCSDSTKSCSRHNITDELALFHLRNNPKCIRLFSRYPDNWEELAFPRDVEEQPIEEVASANILAQPKAKAKTKKKTTKKR